jgi:hypothetical protein
MPAESQMEGKLVAFAKSLGYLSFKFTSPSQAGVPDRCFINLVGGVLFMETKAPGKKPTPIQMRMLKKLRNQGVAAGWTNNLEKGKKMLEEFHRHGTLFFNCAYPV